MVSVNMSLWGLRTIFAALVLFYAMAGSHGAAMAQENAGVEDEAATEEADKGPRPMRERCIPLRRVRSVKILDAQTIIWEVGGGRFSHYRMTLTSKCPGLVGRGAFVHSSSGSRLCDVGEWIRVAGGTRAICSIDRIEPWSPPDEEDGGNKDKSDSKKSKDK
jgi:hypothetical protein